MVHKGAYFACGVNSQAGEVRFVPAGLVLHPVASHDDDARRRADYHEIIAGGNFDVAGDIEVAYIARWNGTTWRPLAAGITEPFFVNVDAFTVYDDHLIVGGGFTGAGGVPVENIAAWDGASWSPLGSGITAENYCSVSALAVFDGELIAGGLFDTAGGEAASNIARWNGTSWAPLGSGLDNHVVALTVLEGDLIAGGLFEFAGVTPVARVARWDGSTWSPLGTGIDDPYGDVFALGVYEDELVAAGRFREVGGISISTPRGGGATHFSLPAGHGHAACSSMTNREENLPIRKALGANRYTTAPSADPMNLLADPSTRGTSRNRAGMDPSEFQRQSAPSRSQLVRAFTGGVPAHQDATTT